MEDTAKNRISVKRFHLEGTGKNHMPVKPFYLEGTAKKRIPVQLFHKNDLKTCKYLQSFSISNENLLKLNS